MAHIDQHAIVQHVHVPCGSKYAPPANRGDIFSSARHLGYITTTRGLKPLELQSKWGVEAIGWCPEFQYRDRLFFPVHDNKGTSVSWVTRTINENNKYRYLAAHLDRERVPLKTILYGERYVSPFDTVIGVCISDVRREVALLYKEYQEVEQITEKAKSKIEVILMILRTRFSGLPDDIVSLLDQITDLETLDEWAGYAVISESLDEFSEVLRHNKTNDI